MLVKKFLLASSILAVSMGIAVARPAPYVGAGVGIVNNTANVKFNGQNFTYGSYRGMPVNVFAGYGGVLSQNFYLAGEVFGTVTTLNISDSKDLKTTYSYGISAIPGYMLGDTLVYVRAGLLRSRFSEANEIINGAQFGAGMQASLTQNVDIRGEYDFVAYESKNEGFASLAARSDQATVSVIYKFE